MKLLPDREVTTPTMLVRRDLFVRDNEPRGVAFKSAAELVVKRIPYRLAFAGVALFTLLLYLRPQELFPQFFGGFQLVKLVGAATVAAYLFSRLYWNEKITILPLELKMLLVIYTLGWLTIPFALAPENSIQTLTDDFLKVIIVFVLMINVLIDRTRLLLIMKLIVLCGSVLAGGAIKNYLEGNFSLKGVRIEGIVGGIFGNPNDLATSLDLIIPLAIVLAITQRGIWRLLCLISIPVLILGVIVTFSRSGFLGLLLVAVFLIWKLGEKNRARIVLTFSTFIVVLLLAMPGSYKDRLSTIFDTKSDETGSAQERKEVLNRAIWLAVRRPIIGVGMSNFGRYSIREMLAHNSYFEISAELGVAGLIAYLILIFGPLKSCRIIERQTRSDQPALSEASISAGLRRRELHLLSIGLQATLYAYILCSFFASIQYLWFLYYPVAYVVALRGIKQTEELQITEAQAGVQVFGRDTLKAGSEGVIWNSTVSRNGKHTGGVFWKNHLSTSRENLFAGGESNRSEI